MRRSLTPAMVDAQAEQVVKVESIVMEARGTTGKLPGTDASFQWRMRIPRAPVDTLAE